MAETSKIEWTDATWNPVRGCSVVSKGCTNCYAMKQAHRFSGPGKAYEGLTKLTNGGPVWTGDIKLVHDALDQPLRWKKPRHIFVNSMSDLFHGNVPFDYIAQVFHIMTGECSNQAAPDHIYQILTKRPRRMLAFFKWLKYLVNPEPYIQALQDLYRHSKPPSNVWLGVSAENQETADERIPLLLQTPAAVRFISAEPLLKQIDLKKEWVIGDNFNTDPYALDATYLDWVIVGGESGPKARPMHPDWSRKLRDQCQAANVPFFFKQWGEFDPEIGRVGKKKAGRLLDGQTYSEFPERGYGQ